METKEQQAELVKTARITGIWYLMLGITGMLGFLLFHPQIFVSEDPAKTLENLTQRELFARGRVLLELGVVLSQALAAIWFYKLFRGINPVAALATGIWGTVNSVAIMVSAMSMGAAIKIANGSAIGTESKVATIQILEQLSANSWGVGGIFFGLWLIPMGYTVVSSQRMPVWLGRILMVGGIGYILHTAVNYIGVSSDFVELLVIPATIGEFWMIGYLLIFGIRPER